MLLIVVWASGLVVLGQQNIYRLASIRITFAEAAILNFVVLDTTTGNP